MDGRNHCRSAFCALAVALAGGCASLGGVRPDAPLPPPEPRGKFVPRTHDNPLSGTGVKPAGGPVAAGAVVPAGDQVPAVPVRADPPPGGPVALPIPKPSPPPNPAAADPAKPGTPTAPGAACEKPGTGAPGTPGMFVLPDPTVRAMPTATGARLNLGRGEVPADRLVELSQYLEAAHAQNRELAGRVRELEALGAAREQALAEALGEVEIATAEVARTRAALQALQAKLLLIETEDIETLKAVIAALERLISPPGRKDP